MNIIKLLLIITLILPLSGCFLTKVVTVPMRVTGAIISVVPVVGDVVDETIDTAADVVDGQIMLRAGKKNLRRVVVA